MKKKFLSIILVLSMLFAFMPVIAVAETSGTCGENLTWTLDDNGTLTISGTGDMIDYYYRDSPFYYNSSIKSVIIENGVTSIGEETFSDCLDLTSVTIPNSVASIGTRAFGGNNNLDSVYISDLTAYLNIDFEEGYGSNPMCYADKLYLNNKRITSLEIPKGVVKIPNYAFHGCSSLISVTIPDSVTSIGSYAFENCTGLTSVTIPDSVTSIGQHAFNNCNNLDSVYITDLVAYLNIDFDDYYGSNPMCDADKLYLNNRLVTSLKIPEGAVKISDSMFSDCADITSVMIPDSVTSIGRFAFEGCSGLTSITIPDSVINIAEWAFSYCDGLKSVTIGNGMTRIDECTFYYCDKLEKIIIPKTVTEIESGAFGNCSKLVTVEYGGNKEDWDEMYIGTDNDYLKNAKINYNSRLVPTPKPTPTPTAKPTPTPTPKPTPIPTTTAEITKSETDKTYNFDVVPEATYANCYVYAAVYDESGVLLAVNRVPLALTGNTSISVDKKDNAAKAKVFIWADTLQPIITAEEFSLI